MIPKNACLVARVLVPNIGPCIARVDGDRLIDVTANFLTMRDLCEHAHPSIAVRAAKGVDLGTVADILANTAPDTRNKSKPWLLAPVDLQAIKAAGVTFVVSMLERVIEEKARGDAKVRGGASILGGNGHYIGTVAGVILITLLQSILSVLQPQLFFADLGFRMPAEVFRQIAFGVVIIAMLLLYGRERLQR